MILTACVICWHISHWSKKIPHSWSTLLNFSFHSFRVLLDWIAGLLNLDCNPIWWIGLWSTIQSQNWILDLDCQSSFVISIQIQNPILTNTGIQFGIHVASTWMLPQKPALTYSQSPFWASTMDVSFPRCIWTPNGDTSIQCGSRKRTWQNSTIIILSRN